ncbi:MAG: hypothetical protein JXR96_26655 [Deltaproteobacteria bacterium]|nr:hypothetical protein [Deltaproteobacteria bacterium]
MGSRTRAVWIACLALELGLLASACCHVNQFAQSEPVRAVNVVVPEPPPLDLEFSRRKSVQGQRVMGRIAADSRSEFQYKLLLESLGGAELAHALGKQVTAALDRTIGWKSEPGDTELELRVVQALLIAADPTADVSVRVDLEIVLTRPGGALIWRDCPSWDWPMAGYSLQRLNEMSVEMQRMFLDALAASLASRLSGRIEQESKAGVRP